MIDNAHRMCPTSWNLFDSIMTECERVVIFLLKKVDVKDRCMVITESKETYQHVWTQVLADDDINLHVVDLPRLKEKQIEAMLIHSALNYKSTYMREVEGMTSILDPS